MRGTAKFPEGGRVALSGILLFLFLLVCPASSLTPPQVQWEKFYGGSSSDEGFAITLTSDGGYLLSGNHRQNTSVTSSDAWMIKTDANGNAIWNRSYGGPRYDSFSDTKATLDGGYILTGSTLSFSPGGEQVAWLVKTDSFGVEVWNRTYESGVRGTAVIQTPDGGYVVAGITGGDAHLFKTSPDGTLIWERRYGGAAADMASSAIMTSDGGFAISGTTLSFGIGEGRERMVWLIKADENGNEVWNRTYGHNRISYGNAVQEIPGGGYIVVGYTDPYPTPGNRSVFFVRTGADGYLQWEKTPGDHGLDEGMSVQVTPDGGFLIGGISWTRAFLQKTDAAGNLLWDGRFGAGPNSHFNAVGMTDDGGYIAIGSYLQETPGDWDVYLVKFAPEAPPRLLTSRHFHVPVAPPFLCISPTIQAAAQRRGAGPSAMGMQ